MAQPKAIACDFNKESPTKRSTNLHGSKHDRSLFGSITGVFKLFMALIWKRMSKEPAEKYTPQIEIRKGLI